jgi:GT2 family glycosyltransferase
VSAVIVNYESADFAIPCARSLLQQRIGRSGGASAGAVEVIVVDNASSVDDRAKLAGLPAETRLIEADRNLGYGGAANVGFAAARGDHLCLLNPDVLVLPGALDALVSRLASDPKIGAVGPRTWMDEGRNIQHPINRLPSLGRMLRGALHLRSATAIREASLEVTRHSVLYWRASEPCAIEMLSGAFLVAPRRVVERVGGFDEAFPLYYEDADWCRRIGRAGYRLEYVPAAEIVHYYNMSAGKAPEAARRKREASRRVYFRKAFGRCGAALAERLARAAERRMASVASSPPWAFRQLGALDRPPTFDLPDPESVLVAEFAGTPDFEYPAASLVHGRSFTFPEDLWWKMPPTEVFVRIVDPRTLAVGPTWRFRRA